ncbi:MAG: glycine cleavage T C-terminal barrel domain-containing protein [Phormidesmis sp.]
MKPNKGDFIGKQALLSRQAYATRRLCFLTLDNPTAVIMGKEPVVAEEGKVLGYATSAGYGYSLGRCVVYAYLPLGYAAPGTKVAVEYFGQSLAATVVDQLLP